MKRRWVIGFSFLLTLFLGVALVNPTSWLMLLGWWRGEAFYRARPTCWWTLEIQEWEPVDFNFLDSQWTGGKGVLKTVRPTICDRWSAPFTGRILIEFHSDDIVLLSGDPASLPVLVELLKSESVTTRRIAARGIKLIGPEAKSAFPSLLELANDENEDVRRDVLRALYRIDKEAAMREGLQDPWELSRY